MFTGIRKGIVEIALPILLIGFAGMGVASTHRKADPAVPNNQPLGLAEQVRHELAMLPYYGVFDDLSFTLKDSNTVVLSGQVVRPMLKHEAEAAVSQVPGISKVENNIETLPLSSFDNAIRLRTYWAIFSRSGFEKYAIQAHSPLRIIVKNGNITLEGVVANQFDKTIAYMAARSVPGAFSVTNNLIIGYSSVSDRE
jgi:hyperosmotically inducible protein